MVDIPRVCAAIQQDLERLVCWVEKNIVVINKGRCRFLHLEEHCIFQYRLGHWHTWEHLCRKEPRNSEGQVSNESVMCPCVQEGRCYPGVQYEECCQKTHRSYPPCLLKQNEDTSVVPCPVLGSPVQQRHENTEERPAL